MSDLRKKLIDPRTPFAAAGSIDAPELGAGEKVWIARLTFGERETVSEIAQDKESKPAERMRKLLEIFVAEEDGAAVFEGHEDPAIGMIPATLADRIIDAGMEMNSGSKDAKKPSSPAAN